MSGTAVVPAVVIAATAIHAAPEGFEPGYVLALVDVAGARRLVRLEMGPDGPPRPGSSVPYRDGGG